MNVKKGLNYSEKRHSRPMFAFSTFLQCLIFSMDNGLTGGFCEPIIPGVSLGPSLKGRYP